MDFQSLSGQGIHGLHPPLLWGEPPVNSLEATEAGFLVPVGTVTFLLTDIEGSTRMWEAADEAMAAATARQYELVGEAIGRHGGVRPVEQGEGDSVVGAFSRASDALSCAVAIQRALAAEPWPEGAEVRLRMALHTGDAQLRDEGNYFGYAISRCARLRAIAHGGQTLLSHATYDLVVDRLPDGVTLTDLGIHRLRDLARPEHVYQLCHPGLREEFPPLRSLDAVPNNLPVQLTSFIGREAEMDEIKRLLSQSRVLTITGSGGCGKTRLAVQVAADMLDDFPDGVWWADLAPIGDPGLVANEVASTLSLKEVPMQSFTDTVKRHLRERRALLILDNCEHVVSPCAELAATLLRGCPQVAIIATSREPLGVEGETAWLVPSLTMPDEARPPAIESLSQYEAVRLFVDRAVHTRPNFRITNDNAPAVADICRRLDGIPLAIELAAARVRLLAPEQIREGLSDRFHLLSGGARTALPRQQTLQASVDWSHNLLSEDERALLRRLSVFAGGFTLDAAEDVCSGDRIEGNEILDLLSQLVDKSLVQVEEPGWEARYRLLETIRQYGLQKLADAEEVSPVRDRHLDFYLGFVENVAPELDGPHMLVWLARLRVEEDNIRAALDYGERSDPNRALRFARPLWMFWFIGARFTEARARLEKLLAAADVDPSLRATGLAVAGTMSSQMMDLAAGRVFCEESVQIAREVGATGTLAGALTALAWIQAWSDPTGARFYVEEAVEIARQEGNHFALIRALNSYGAVEFHAGDLSHARRLLQEAVELADGSGNPFALHVSLLWLAFAALLQGLFDETESLVHRGETVASDLGDEPFVGLFRAELGFGRMMRGQYEAARALFDEAVAIGEKTNSLATGTAALGWRGWLGYAEGDVAAARTDLEQTLQAWRLIGSPWAAAWTLVLLSRLCHASGDLVAAKGHADEALSLARESGNLVAIGFALHACARALLPDGEYQQAESMLREALTLVASVEARGVVAEVLETLAETVAWRGSYHEAARLSGAAQSLRDAIGYVRFPSEREPYDAGVDAVRQALDTQVFDNAWSEGAGMSMEEAVAYASRARGPRKRPKTGWASLTPAELDVARLVVEGLSNPEIGERLFVSRRTIQTHLSHVFAKLGISSRAELAAQGARRDI